MFDLKQIVYDAAALIPIKYTETDSVIEKDGKKNVVTHYDKEVQEFLTKRIRESYPDASFLGEEELNSINKEQDILFIIDPIDGTSNFVNNCKFSSISVAMLKQGRLCEAAVYNPYLDEMFFAIQGGGAWLNDKRISVPDMPLSDSIIGYSYCPYDNSLSDVSFEFGKILFERSLDFRRMGSAALEICYTACGRYQLYCEMILYPWDYAAAALILTEAGGVITDIKGGDVGVDKRYSIIAGCPTAHDEVIELYKKHIDEKKYSMDCKTQLFDG